MFQYEVSINQGECYKLTKCVSLNVSVVKDLNVVTVKW